MVGSSLKQRRRPKTGRISATELCQRLKPKAAARQDASADNDLRLRILDYLIALEPPDDIFQGLTKKCRADTYIGKIISLFRG